MPRNIGLFRQFWRAGRVHVIAVVWLALPAIAAAQVARHAPAALTADDYRRAETFMGYNTNPLVFGAIARVAWLPDDRFWYLRVMPERREFVLVDPASGARTPAFDHAAIAAGLSRATGTTIDAARLPFTDVDFSPALDAITVTADGRRWTCQLAEARCATAAAARTEVLSPDRRRAAFIRNDNLWLRDVASGQERPLTTDGVKDFGYATDNAGWTRSDRAIVVWSPDSKKIATFQQDQRDVREMYLVDTRVGHPVLQAWKYPLPGDTAVAMIHRVVIDVEKATVTRLKLPPDQHRSTLCDHVTCGGTWADVEWSADSTQLAFVSSSRDHKVAQLRIADASTGAVRDVLEERVTTFFESGNGRVNWHVLPASNEVIWFSARSNWGQLYLYDLRSGVLKRAITTGDGNVTQVLRVDEANRVVYFVGVGREPGRDPYFRHLYRVGFDGSQLQLLTPENADHDISLAPSGRSFVDRYSTPDTAPVAVLRDLNGAMVATLETTDISRLVATGWKPPMPITVKARDGKTDLYGLLYRPTTLDPAKKYPIVNRIYPGPQTGSVGSRSFSAARSDSQALAELGFVVVEIDGMGTPWRSKSFHEAYYGDMGDNTLPDQVAGMKELAQRYPWIDLERAGIWGHSGGGFAAGAAMFRYPDVFKVGISEAGNHDNRVYEDDWGEKWQGLLEERPDKTTNYDNQANQLIAKNLKGKLLLAHGTMDSNVPPNNTLLVVDALIRANKDFDLIMLPNRGHGFGNEPYMVRRRWDYFVRHLLGAEPPREYEMRGAARP